MGASFWEERPPKPLRSLPKTRRVRWKKNPQYASNPRPYVPPLRVSVRADLLDRAADLIADRDPALSVLFKRMAKENAA